MRTKFQQGLDELKQRLLEMGGMAESAVEMASGSYLRRDATLCEKVFAREKEINAFERRIDELALDLLAMQQPMAVDLRFVVAVLKINADLERVGDQAVNIAQRTLDLLKDSPVDIPVDIARMAGTVSTMVRRALESFLSAHADVAEAVLEMDNVVDRMKDEAFVTLVSRMKSDPAQTQQYLDALLITRNLERVADHATNIAEDVIFWVRGADVRHGAQLEMRERSENAEREI
jgi:phosphate transport system protein